MVLRGQIDGLAQSLDGCLVVTTLIKDAAEIPTHFRVVGSQDDRVFALAAGLIVLTQAGQGDAQNRVGIALLRIQLDRLAGVNDGFLVAASAQLRRSGLFTSFSDGLRKQIMHGRQRPAIDGSIPGRPGDRRSHGFSTGFVFAPRHLISATQVAGHDPADIRKPLIKGSNVMVFG